MIPLALNFIFCKSETVTMMKRTTLPVNSHSDEERDLASANAPPVKNNNKIRIRMHRSNSRCRPAVAPIGDSTAGRMSRQNQPPFPPPPPARRPHSRSTSRRDNGHLGQRAHTMDDCFDERAIGEMVSNSMYNTQL